MKKIRFVYFVVFVVVIISIAMTLALARVFSYNLPKDIYRDDLQLGQPLSPKTECHVSNEVYQNIICRVDKDSREAYVAVDWQGRIIYVDWIIPDDENLTIGDLILKLGQPIAIWPGSSQTIVFWQKNMAFTRHKNFSPNSHVTFVSIGGNWKADSFAPTHLWHGFRNN